MGVLRRLRPPNTPTYPLFPVIPKEPKGCMHGIWVETART